MEQSDECRKLAADYRRQSAQGEVSPRRAAVLRNIANSLTALASQYDILDVINAEEKG
jgi:hypothetical protein